MPPQRHRSSDPLRAIPGVGPSIAADLRKIGIREVADLRGCDPEHLYDRSNRLRGVRQDRCLLYVFRCAVYFASTKRPDPERLKWWNWSDAALLGVRSKSSGSTPRTLQAGVRAKNKELYRTVRTAIPTFGSDPNSEPNSRYVAFLRAVNVGGHTVTMDELRRLFASFGFSNVETFIASGNVVFETRGPAGKKLESTIEAGLRKALGYDVATFLRSTTALSDIAAYQPFSPKDLAAARTLVVAFLTEPLDEAAARRLLALRTDIDDFHVHGREIYWLCRTKQSDSTFSNVVFEKAVGRKTTFRSVTTVRKMAAKYAPGTT